MVVKTLAITAMPNRAAEFSGQVVERRSDALAGASMNEKASAGRDRPHMPLMERPPISAVVETVRV